MCVGGSISAVLFVFLLTVYCLPAATTIFALVCFVPVCGLLHVFCLLSDLLCFFFFFHDVLFSFVGGGHTFKAPPAFTFIFILPVCFVSVTVTFVSYLICNILSSCIH